MAKGAVAAIIVGAVIVIVQQLDGNVLQPVPLAAVAGAVIDFARSR